MLSSLRKKKKKNPFQKLYNKHFFFWLKGNSSKQREQNPNYNIWGYETPQLKLQHMGV
jgi:hypothetical protein